MQNKKILFVCQYFYPETFRGNDIAFHLAKKGHNVHVLTGTPNYPIGKFYDGYGIFKKRHEVINGVRITHLPILPRGNNKIMLVLNFFNYMIFAWIYILFHAIFHKYDIVFCQQLSPVIMSSPAVLYKKLRHVPLYTWVLDLWPESLTVSGEIKNKYIIGFFRRFVASEYKYSDKILISSRSFVESIREYGDYEDKIIYYPQWSDGTSDVPTDFEIPKIQDGFKIMFAGAMGEAHGFECNMQAALLTKKHKNIKWIIVGDGRKLGWVKKFVSDNKLGDTVYTLGRFPSNTMPLFFEKADAMLVSLADSPLFSLYAPAKISSYMASGRPIIACLNGEGAEVIKDANCGWCINAGDAESLAKLVIKLSQTDKSVLNKKGNNGRLYYIEHFDKERCLKKLDEIMGLN
ncbi:glycosyltransferase family 4 protein [Parabacteroides distasonis]|jgi:glycosyltransferase involved in cell wall biosynthesis|uniref:glycosyltransferase family 4 protein n=1 Tax=Parabacteroides distasonis TaxID=823 RepID=UPI00189A9842|nr:glycosyltransferase family 4 protein [Parabacteroides distasonis]MDB8998125.1 glycosyltransferase family 4 protein [Parabacteroides distasonis]MDB9072770.1 glycosyltransferase family 4 protein [Parabacteroides distasonis]